MKNRKKSIAAIVTICMMILMVLSVQPMLADDMETGGASRQEVLRTVPGYYGVTADVLNVRSGPGTNYSIVGQLYYGQAILVNSISNGWARFKYNGINRYAKADYLIEFQG